MQAAACAPGGGFSNPVSGMCAQDVQAEAAVVFLVDEDLHAAGLEPATLGSEVRRENRPKRNGRKGIGQERRGGVLPVGLYWLPLIAAFCTETAYSHRGVRLRIVRQLLKRQADKQQQFDFVDEHPIIRPLADYTAFVASAIQRKAASPRGFLRHGLGVRGVGEKSPDGPCHQGSGASSTRPRSG